MDSINDLANWQFWVACLFVAGVIWTIKTFTGNLSPHTLDKAWYKALLTLCNPLFGLVAALKEGFLKGDTLEERAMLGVGVGLISQFVYQLVLKRLGEKLGVNPPGVVVEPSRSEKKTDPDIKVTTGGP